MKKLTCSDIGGVCDAEISGETAEELMVNAKSHVHGTEDEAHKELVTKMEKISDEELAAWQKDTMEKFDAAPEA